MKLYSISVNTGEYVSMLSASGFCNMRLCVMCVCMQAMSRHAFEKSATHCKSWWRTNCKLYCAFTRDRSPVEFIILFHKILNIIDLFVNTICSVNHAKALVLYLFYWILQSFFYIRFSLIQILLGIFSWSLIFKIKFWSFYQRHWQKNKSNIIVSGH